MMSDPREDLLQSPPPSVSVAEVNQSAEESTSESTQDVVQRQPQRGVLSLSTHTTSPLEAHELADMLHHIGVFVLSQGAYPDRSAFALTYLGRCFQALSLSAPETIERYTHQARSLTPSERVQLGVNVASLLSPWTNSVIDESTLSEFFRAFSATFGGHGPNLSALLSALNDELLSPLKTRLNPRRLIEVEERLGAILYHAVLNKKLIPSQDFLPASGWPEVKGYQLLKSLPPRGDLFSFYAIRTSDQARCLLYLSDEPISLHPNVEDSEWPAHCVKPLEYGRLDSNSSGPDLLNAPTEAHWVSVPMFGGISLRDLIPYTDTFTALYLGEQLLENLAALHRLGIAYQDVTPDRVIIDHRFQLRLLPYVRSESIASKWSRDIVYLEDVESVYASPEQRAGARGDSRADLWSFGAIFQELLTHKTLLQVSSLSEFTEVDSTSGITPLNDDFSNNLKVILRRCLHPNPDHRWSDAQRALEAYRPVAAEVRQHLKSRGRSSQWSRVIGEGHLRTFVDSHLHAPPHPVAPAFFSYLEDHDVSLSTAEDPTPLLTTLFAQEESLQEDLAEWRELSSGATQAKNALISKIRERGAEILYDSLEDLIDEKRVIQQALTQAQAKMDFYERRRPKLFGLALEQFVKQEELDIQLSVLLDDDWAAIGVLPAEREDEVSESSGVPQQRLDQEARAFDELDADLSDSSGQSNVELTAHSELPSAEHLGADSAPLRVQISEKKQEYADALVSDSTQVSQENPLSPVEPPSVSLIAPTDHQLDSRPEDEPQFEDAKPEDAKPEDAKPEDAQPEDAQPEDAQPEDAQPDDEPQSAPEHNSITHYVSGEFRTLPDHALMEDFADLSMLEQNELPEDEEPDDTFSFNEFTGIEPLDFESIEEMPIPTFDSNDAYDDSLQFSHAPLEVDADLSIDLISEGIDIVESSHYQAEHLADGTVDIQSEAPIGDVGDVGDQLAGGQGDDSEEELPVEVSLRQLSDDVRQSRPTREVGHAEHEPKDTSKSDQIQPAEAISSLAHFTSDLSLDDEMDSLDRSLDHLAQRSSGSSEPSSQVDDQVDDQVGAQTSQITERMTLTQDGLVVSGRLSSSQAPIAITETEERQLRELYDRYYNLKVIYEESTEGLTYDVFLEQVQQAQTHAMTTHGWDAVRFTVKLKEGRVVLKAKRARL